MQLPPIYFFSSSSTKSGGARQAAYLARGLVDAGHTLTFFVPHDSEVPDLDGGLHWVRLPEDRGRWRSGVEEHLPRDSSFIFQAFHNKAVKKLAFWGLSWRRRGGICFGYRGLMRRPGNPFTYWSPGLNGIIVNSKACADVLARSLVPRSRLHVVYNAMPRERIEARRPAGEVRRELDLSESDLVFGSVAGSKPVKGVKELLEAFVGLGEDAKRARLVVVGSMHGQWRELIKGYEELVRFVPRTEHVSDYLQVFDVFVLPSLSESMPNTVLEAVCAGLPLMASRVGGVPEIVDGNGLLFEPGDVHAMTKTLRTMIEEPELRARFAARSEEIRPRFDLAAKVAHVEAIYDRETGRIA